MSWFKVDDMLAFNAKVVAVGNEAMGLWVRAGSWCASQLKGGFVPNVMANAMRSPMANGMDIAALVSVGLWHEVDGGYVFHDWEDYQPSADQEREKRQRRSDAGKRGAEARWGHGNSHSNANGNRMANGDATAMPPSRPVLPVTPSGVTGGARKRGTRLSDDFKPSEKARETILSEHPTLDLRREHARFMDHWKAQPGQRGVKADWDATWRNWMRRAADDMGRGRQSTRQQETDDLFARAAARLGVTDQPAIDGRVL